MTGAELATLHARASGQPWSAANFNSQLRQQTTVLNTDPNGFAIGRIILDEAELLQIAVARDFQRQGLGKRLLTAFEQSLKRQNCSRALLEVAVGNAGAIALYKASGWVIDGKRANYYRKSDGTREDAYLMSKIL